MGIVAEFKKFNAVQKNHQWSVSAINPDRELVVSLWSYPPLLTKHPSEKKQIYSDSVKRWSGNGSKEFKANLDEAFKHNLKVRTVLVRLEDSSNFKHILEGNSGTKYEKTFYAKENWIGQLTYWDGENFKIEFTLDTP